MNVKRDTLKLKETISENVKNQMSDEDVKKVLDGMEFFVRGYIRYRCIEIASQMDVHGNANEVILRAEKFVDFIFDEEDDE